MPRVVSRHTRNQSQVSVARLRKLAWYQHLLQFAIHALHMGSQEMETTPHNIGNVAELVDNLPAHSAPTSHKSVGRMEPNNFHLVGPLTKHLAGRRFAPDTKKKQDVISWLQTLGTNFFYYNSRTSLGAMLWQMLKYQCWLCADLMFTTYYPCAMYTSRSK